MTLAGAEPDPFGAAPIRERVLAAWAASPPRFREDANAEEDLALGGYRDRLVIELAQNAADAAARAGVPGRLLLALRAVDGGSVLVAANSGAPLDAEGVQALATLRASAKRDEWSVGRFGVGFAAVLAVTDEPAVVSRPGGVRFSAADTRRLVGSAPAFAGELQRRDGHVPVLRLPFPAQGSPPDGYDTAVLLPLRDAAAEDLVLRLLDDLGDPLLLALPALDEITVELPGRAPLVLRDVASRWHTLHRTGTLAPALLADRPTEDRARPTWSLTWAAPEEVARPRSRADLEGGVVHAPTPTEEPLPWPALLVASFPLDTSRRHVAPGPATDALAGYAAEAYLELLAERAEAGDEAWSLLPTGAPAGALDGLLRAALADRLPAAPILRAAEDPAVPVRPRDAVVLARPAGADRAVVAAFAPWVAGLIHVPSGGPPPAAHGIRELGLTDLVEALPQVPDPARWREVYAALEPLAVDPLVREALAALPVPLADGRVVRGARGTVQLAGEDGAAALALLGVRTVHPEAAHPLLERLGAAPSGPRAVLDLPAVRAVVEESADAEDPAAVADAVLGLVAAAVRAGELGPGDLPVLGELALPDDTGEPAPAAALALPGSDAARWFDPDEIGPIAPELAARWGADVLAAAGVLTGVPLLRAHGVLLETDGEPEPGEPDPAELEGWDDWCGLALEEAAAAGLDTRGATLAELVALGDLDVLRPGVLPEVVTAAAADPLLRPALVAPARITAGGAAADVLPITAWWLRDRLGAPLAAGGPLAGLLPAAPGWLRDLDPAVRHALGVVAAPADLDADAVPGVLDRLADPSLDVAPGLLLDLVARFADLAAAGLEIDPPGSVRVPAGAATEVVPAADAVVLDAPMYRQRADLGAALPAPPARAAALADLLDLPLASELVAGSVEEDGVLAEVPAPARALLPGCPATWCEHESLLVDGQDVSWWVTDGAVHAATPDGLARGLAWAAGRWDLRAVVAEVLAAPDTLADLLADEQFS